MPYLNLKNAKLELKKTEHPRLETQLELAISPENHAALVSELETSFSTGQEFRLDLPQNWTLYWKIKSGQTRLSLARPQLGSWVAALNFSQDGAAQVLKALKENATEVRLSQFGPLAPFSNFELIITCRGDLG